MPDIKIKRYADKENLKKLMKYSKDTFANKNEINDKFYTKEQIDTMLGSLSNYYTKSEVDNLLSNIKKQIDSMLGSGDFEKIAVWEKIEE